MLLSFNINLFFLQIRGGSQTGPILGTFCGRNKTITADLSFNGPLHILFKSDSSVNDKGFRAEVRGKF